MYANTSLSLMKRRYPFAKVTLFYDIACKVCFLLCASNVHRVTCIVDARFYICSSPWHLRLIGCPAPCKETSPPEATSGRRAGNAHLRPSVLLHGKFERPEIMILFEVVIQVANLFVFSVPIPQAACTELATSTGRGLSDTGANSRLS